MKITSSTSTKKFVAYTLKTLAVLMSILILSGCSTTGLNNIEQEFQDIVANQVDSDNEYVLMVKHGYRSDNPNLTYEQAFENFFGTPRWKYFKSTEGQDVVEFTGDCTYDGNAVKARIQFIVHKDEGTFEIYTLAFNEIPQNTLILAALMEKVFGGSDDITNTNNNAYSNNTNLKNYTAIETDTNIMLGATYSSKEKEISFNYPSDWRTEKEDSDNIQVAYGINKSKPQGAALVLRRCDKGTIDEMTDYYNQELAEIIMPYINNSAFLSQLSYGMTDISIINLNPITLDSVKAFRLELTGKLYYYGEMHMVGYFYDTKYSGYQLMLIYSDSERTKYEPIINKIIDSIRINIDETKPEPQTEAPTEEPTEMLTEAPTEKPTEKPTEPTISASNLTGLYISNSSVYNNLSVYGIGDTIYVQVSYHAGASVNEGVNCWGYFIGYGKLNNNAVDCNLYHVSQTIYLSSGTQEWEWNETANQYITFDIDSGTAMLHIDTEESFIFTKNDCSISNPIAGEVNIDDGCLNVRNGDSTDADIVGTLNKGDKVLILNSSSDWYVVLSNNIFGYVYVEYIKPYG